TVEAGHTLNVFTTHGVSLGNTAKPPAVLAATLTNAATPAIALASGSLELDSPGATQLNLSAAPHFPPPPRPKFPPVRNVTGQLAQGVFDDTSGNALNEGDVVHVGALDFTISYKGGTGNDVVLTYVGMHQFPVTIDSNFLAQYGTLNYTLNGQTEQAGNQTFELPVGPSVITYQKLDLMTGVVKTYRLTFN